MYIRVETCYLYRNMESNSVHPFSEDQVKTITLEFYLEDMQLFVRYNNQTHLFRDFWKQTEGAELICRRIYEAFLIQHRELLEDIAVSSKNWLETFLKIINNHLSEKTPILDVFMRANGDVIINLER